MAIPINGKSLTIDRLASIARGNEKVELSSEAVDRIRHCRNFVEERLAAGDVMYGLNTGIGEFSEVALDEDQVKDFQRFLIYNHAAGIGEPCPVEHVRAAMASRVNVHAKGHSGPRVEIPMMYVEMLNKGVTPVVCSKGSVGACGDLAPMSQIALVLMGEGECFYEGARMSTQKALERTGIKAPGLEARDGLAAINGSNLLTSISALTLHDAERWLKQAEIAAAMSLEALIANMKPYDQRLHEMRGFRGAVTSARNISTVLAGSDLLTGKKKTRVQDAYSMRSTPQVIGAARDQFRWTREQIETELNGVCDNPVFLPDEGTFLTGANFQGTPVSLPVDTMATAITMISVLSERRLNRLLNPALSAGLPAFLTKGAGMYSGHMLSQYTADMLIVEQRILSTPASIQSIPAAADQEDFVSMGMNAALKARQIMDNAQGILGIEFIAATQGLDFRDHEPGAGVRAAHGAVREVVDHLDVDRPLFADHNNMAAAVERLDVLTAVESEVGKLDFY